MKDSYISWTHHTFNPWVGCDKIAPECAHRPTLNAIASLPINFSEAAINLRASLFACQLCVCQIAQRSFQ